jgi:hypothetical protein
MLEVKPQPVPGPARSDPHAGLSIAEAARRTGVSVHTLRYYERAGLVVTPIDRTHGGWRRYQQQDLNWITVLIAEDDFLRMLEPATAAV